MSNAVEPAASTPLEDGPVEELARRQGVAPIRSLDELTQPGSWPSDEEFDDFLADLYRSRRTDVS